MRAGTCLLAVVLATAALGGIAHAARADEDTISQNQLRDGWDPNEPGLSPAVVGSGSFGKLFSTAVNGQVYAQPLVVGGNVLVATENNWLYSLNGETGAVNWSLSLGPAWPSSVVGCGDLTPSIGNTSTPVYDPSTGTLYLTAVVNDGPSSSAPHIYLFAITAQTGAVAWKVPIQGTPTNDPDRPFNPLTERQRASLLLMNGSVYMGFGSYCDYAPYAGYVVGVSTTTKALTMWTDEAGVTDDQGGIWMGGSGLMSDGSGRIFVSTGNGVSPPPGPGTSPPPELGDAVVRLAVQQDGSLAAQDFFSPADAPTLDVDDQDWGSGGPVGLPFGTTTYPDLLVQAGKDGRVFLLNGNGLGGRETGPGGTDNPVSMSGPYGGEWGHPAAFAGGNGADYVYYTGAHDYLRALLFNGSNPAKPVLQDAANSTGTFGYSSGSPVVTSNGTAPASAVVWQVNSSGDAGTNGILEAFDAVPQQVGSVMQLKEIWSAPIGTASKFTTPATDSGRVYVGTRDGHVLGFGSPDSAPLTGSPASFSQVAVGKNSTLSVTVKATATVTVTGVSASSLSAPDPFTPGQPNESGSPVNWPVTLSAGHTLTVPVTFAPSGPGGATGSLAFATNTQNFTSVTISLSGNGTKPGFYASPTALAFGTVPDGTSNQLQTVITNGGTAAETVTATTVPGGPFSVTGLPAKGTSVPAGGSRTLTVIYKPSATGNATGTLAVTGPDGTASVSLSGTGVAGQGALTAVPSSAGFGNVPLGQAATQTVDVTDTGNLPVTITRFTAPPVPFGTPAPATTGLTLDPGYDLELPVTFTPQSLGTVSGAYQLTLSDGHNPARTLTIPVSGTGTAPASGIAVSSPGGGWTANGNAGMYGTSMELTQAANNQKGSVVSYQPLASNGLHARFTVRLGGGTGADGMTFSLLNAASTTTSALGAGGAELGFGGLPGVAVAFDTFKNAGYPSSNFAGIATGSANGHLTFAATSTAIPALRKGTHVVGVAVSGRTVTVTVDGKQYLSAAVAVPPTVLAAFTAGTGGLNDIHAVSAVSISSGATVVPPVGGGWSYNGRATMTGSGTTLTTPGANEAGSVVYPVPVAANGLHAQFSARLNGGSGGEGLTFALLSPTTGDTALGAAGGGLGFAGLSGVAVTLDTHKDAGYPTANFAGLATGSKNGLLTFKVTVSEIGQLRSGIQMVSVSVAGGVITVFLDGQQVIQTAVSLPSKVVLAFTGGTSSFTDWHSVANAAISAAS